MQSFARQPLRTVEWPTLGLTALIYGGWTLATLFHERLPPLLLAAIGGWLTAWHGSLQHEVIHGHPTPWRRLNTLLAFPPLSLWLPFEAYRRSHLGHHATEHLTDPAHDPESRYAAAWPERALLWPQATLLGRLVLGPVLDVGRFLAGTISGRGRLGLRAWALHVLAVLAILAWLHFVCAMSLGQYLLCFVYPGAALTLIRSFAEHRADADPAHRVAVVERAPVLGLLFLNNNLHAAHHAAPGAPWYRLPGFYRRERGRLLAANGGLVYAGYADVFRRFLLRPHDELSYPVSFEGRR